MQSDANHFNPTAKSMKKTPYILKELSIHKMPGFPRGLKSLQDLAGQVNIIVGPNASGKSSTARMIQQLIWQNNTKGIEAEASVNLEEDSWEIKIDSGRSLVQRNGIDAEFIGLPTAEGQHRYLLALHNLVEGKEADLAKEIAKQSIGGFDLDAAQETLNYSSRFFNKSNSEYREFKKADKKYKEVRNQHKELEKEEERLTDLNSEKNKALLAKKLQDFYEKVADYLKSKSAYTLLAEELNAFPKSIKNCSGDEYDRIQEYENQLEEYRIAIVKAKDEIEKSQGELNMLKIPAHGIEHIIIDEIEERLGRMKEFERDIQALKSKISGFKEEEKIALKTFDDSNDTTKWKGLKLSTISGLDKMLQDAHQVLGEKEFLLAEIKLLSEEAQNQVDHKHSDSTFIQGIKTLSEWLKEPTGGKGITTEMLVLISVIGIITALLTHFFGGIGLLGLILIVILFIYAFLTKDKSSDTLQFREKDFVNSGLKAPSSWNTENVVRRLDELIKNLSDLKEATKIGQRLKGCRDSLDKLQPRIDQINKTREQWIEKLQTDPGFPDSESNDFSSLYWFLQQVKKWQEANTQKESLEAQKKETIAQCQEELDKVNVLFENANFEVVKDATEAKAKFGELKTQEGIRYEEARIIEQKNGEIKNLEESKRKHKKQLSNIYEKLEIQTPDKAVVRELVEKLEDYKRVSKNHFAAEQSAIKNKKTLKEHSLYSKYKEKTKELTIDQVKEKANRQKEIADGLEKIQSEITRIETLIQQKKQGHELEDLLNAKEEALDDLYELYENNLSAVTGDLITRRLKKETQHKNRPKVFRRADQIFNKITNGRYELRLADKGTSSFRAYDTVLKLGQDLSQLSTGTRVQLLIAVRLAYVETVESSIKLPLLADELLANSDDQRAKAIIEALIEISREGRQVFYFTAQADEVRKWLTHLEPTEIDYKVIQLNTDSSELYDHSDFKIDLSSFDFIEDIPSPNGKSHEEYGDNIQIQPFNLLMQNETELPLWYLIDEVDVLYNCLQRGIETWGQLASFYNYGGKIQGLEKEGFQELANHIELLIRFQDLYRKGRTRPIDSDVLANSGAVTDIFMEQVVEKLEEFNRDPKQLIQALKAGEVPRFRTDNIDELEQYLMTKGYIDDEEQQEPDDILIQLQAFISNNDMQIDKAKSFIERVLQSK